MTDGAACPVERRSRWQFSVRTVLLLMVAVAALSALYRAGLQLDVFVLGAAPATLCVRYGVRCWRRRCRPSIPMMAAALSSFGMLYVVSVGPAIILASHSPLCERLLDPIYAPLGWLYAHTSLHDPIEWYVDFWNDFWFDLTR